jgi:S1 RNA binding domain protein
VSLPDNQSGLIHISEVADEYVHDVSDYFREGDAVKVKVLGKRDEGRYELSAKQAEARKPMAGAPQRPAGGQPSRGFGGGDHRERSGGRESSGPQSFEERLTDFLKESNRKQNELKRDRDGRRRGRK